MTRDVSRAALSITCASIPRSRDLGRETRRRLPSARCKFHGIRHLSAISRRSFRHANNAARTETFISMAESFVSGILLITQPSPLCTCMFTCELCRLVNDAERRVLSVRLDQPVKLRPPEILAKNLRSSRACLPSPAVALRSSELQGPTECKLWRQVAGGTAGVRRIELSLPNRERQGTRVSQKARSRILRGASSRFRPAVPLRVENGSAWKCAT